MSLTQKNGGVIDPFSEKLDITKMKSLKKLVDLEESTNIDSPRYPRQLKKKIAFALKKADPIKAGKLTRLEVEKVLLGVDLGISEWDIKVIVSALKAQDDVVSYFEVLKWIKKIVMAFLHRTKATFDFSQVKYIYMEETSKISSLLQKQFKKEDPTGSGYITKEKLKECLDLARLTNEKENILLQLYYCPEGKFDYGKFTEYMYEILYQIQQSQLLDINVNNFKASFKEICEKIDTKKTGQLTLPQLKDALIKFPLLNLTLIQKYDLIAHVNPSLSFIVNYNDFIEQTFTLIQNYTIGNVAKMIESLNTGKIPYKEIEDAQDYDDFDLFDVCI